MIALRRRALAVIVLVWVPITSPTFASAIIETSRPFDQRPNVRLLSIDDVLAMRTFGSVALSPDGRWVVHERRRPYDQAPRFDRGHRSGWGLSDLLITEIAGTQASDLLVSPEERTGMLLGAWSPDSKRLLVYRLKDDRLEAGIVRANERSVVWTGLTPDLPITGLGSAWLDSRRLVMTIRPSGDLPWMLRFDSTGKDEMVRRWQRTVDGREASRSRVETRDHLLTTDASPSPLQLVVLDVVTGDVGILAEGVIRDIQPSPRGDRIAVLTSAERAPSDPSGVIVQSAVQTRSRISIVEVTDGAAIRPAEPIDVAPNLLAWSPDGDAVMVWARSDAQSWQQARMRTIGMTGEITVVDTGDLRPLAPGRNVDELQVVQADWLGTTPVIRARHPSSDRLDWWLIGRGAPKNLTRTFTSPPSRLAAIDDERLLAFADGRLWSVDPTGTAVPVAGADDPLSNGQAHTMMEASRLRTNVTPRRSWTVARSDRAAQIIDADGTVSVQLASGACPGFVLGRSAVETGIATVCLDNGIETLRLGSPKSERILETVNADFAEIVMPRPSAIVHTDHRGRETTSWLFMPPGRVPAEVKGLLIHVYPDVVHDGRYVEATTLAMGPRIELLAGAGYAVLSVAIPSEAESPRSEMIDDFARSTDLAVDAALGAIPGLPEDRMAVIGHSFGGYTSLAIASRSKRYRTHISWAGLTDMSGRWGEFGAHNRIWPEDAFTLDQAIGSTEVGQSGMGGPPWANVAGYAAASPYMLADQIEAPVLLIAADRDYVSLTEAERMLSAMHRQGRWARLVTYWGETHTNASPANIRDVYEEIFAWLDRVMGLEFIVPRSGAAPMPEPSPRSRR